jgi:hypothetical protein
MNKWAGPAVPHYATGVWIVFQPMEMRGMTSGPMPEMHAAGPCVRSGGIEDLSSDPSAEYG